MTAVFVFGGSGYSGLELLRVLASHPDVRVAGASSDRFANEPISRVLAGFTQDLRFESHEALLERARDGVALLATPHEVSRDLATTLIERGLRVIDLSGAFRLEDLGSYAEWYGFTHDEVGLVMEAHYGLPELFPWPAAPVRLVANPGCYATAAQLAVGPLVAAGLVEPTVIIDGKSGVTGAGRKLSDDLLFSEVAESMRPYRVARHQHTPEIEQGLARLWSGGRPSTLSLSFTTHLIPIRRGLLVSAYLRARPGVDQAAIDAVYRERYGAAPFVRVLDRPPETSALTGTNFCDVTATLDARTGTVIAFGALDNLMKGAAGQAVQNLNALLGLDETRGLLPAVRPGETK
jgi:N-acetyl-gamma-glutamyl-phosphate reductase